MIKELHGLIVALDHSGESRSQQRIFVKDAFNGVILGMSKTSDAYLTVEEAKMFARQILAAAKRVENHLTAPQQQPNTLDSEHKKC